MNPVRGFHNLQRSQKRPTLEIRDALKAKQQGIFKKQRRIHSNGKPIEDALKMLRVWRNSRLQL